MATADPLVGRVLEGRYRIQAQLARGGMSTVYSANDERLDRLVAVKVMSPSLMSDPAFVDRFSREARAAAKLTHLNAVSVYDQGFDYGDAGAVAFLVMELVSGRTLRDLLRERGHLSPAEAVSIMEPVLAALAAAHRAGLVHRDVKPENILLADDGVVKVADFGLARAVEADGGSTHTALMMGTVAYCSPEQISRGRTDQRSDVYSAGIVLYELLTGSAPFVGDSPVNVAYQHVHSRVPAPSGRVRDVGRQLDQLVLRATDSEPNGRPLDAGAMLAELADVRSDLALPIVPVPPRPRTAPGRGSRRESANAATSTISADEYRTDALGRPLSNQDTLAVARPIPAAPPRRPVDGPPPPVVIPPPKPPRSKKSRRRRRGLIAVLIVLLLGLASAYGGWWLVSGRWTHVPSVAGLSQSQAETALRDGGFKIGSDVQLDFSETVAKGTVISSDPSGGSRVRRGGIVSLDVSKGLDRVVVPSVVGATQADATQQLRNLRISLNTQTQPDDTVPSGNVIKIDPVAGTAIKPNSPVTLYISSGPPILDVPDVTTKTQKDATAALTALGFKVAVTQDYSATVAKGSVISENPAATSQLAKFQTVTIDVSKGPQTVVIPTIAEGSPVATGTQQLVGLGLVVKVQKQFGGKLGEVVGIDPPSGTTVPVGTTVTLYVV